MKMAICAVLLFTLTVVEATAEARELTYADLVERLYDMKVLATPPAAGEQSGCFPVGIAVPATMKRKANMSTGTPTATAAVL